MLGFTPLAGAALASAGDANTRTVILAATDARDTVAVLLDGSAALYVSATEARDTSDFQINAFWTSFLAASEAADSASFVVQNINVNIQLTDARDVAAFVSAVSGTAALASTEAPDTYSQSAYILWLTPTQPDDPSIWVPKNDPAQYLTTVI